MNSEEASAIIERVVVTFEAAPIPKRTAKTYARNSKVAIPKRNAASPVRNKLATKIGFLPILSLYEPKNETVLSSAIG